MRKINNKMMWDLYFHIPFYFKILNLIYFLFIYIFSIKWTPTNGKKKKKIINVIKFIMYMIKKCKILIEYLKYINDNLYILKTHHK